MLGLLAFCLTPDQMTDAAGMHHLLGFAAHAVVGVGTWMAAWWLCEAVPLPVTSLLPLGLFPLLGVTDFPGAAAPYADPLIFLFLGGFMLSIAIEKWQLHAVFATRLLGLVGKSPAHLVAAVMGITGFISLWLSNTATAVLMLPVALSLAAGAPPAVRKCLLLGVAYGATIGGMGTLIGTPPNLFVASFLAKHHHVDVSFSTWAMLGLPMVGVMLPFTWLLLTRWCFPLGSAPALVPSFEPHAVVLGPAARRVLGVFALAASAWILRAWLVELDLLGFKPLAGLTDPGIAMLAALSLFLLPAGDSERNALLAWQDTVRVPWGTLLLFGGGLSLAGAITASGVDRALGVAIAGGPPMPTWLVLALIAATVVFISEVASNIATAAAMAPLLAAAAPALGISPTVAVVVTGLAASSAYMMPVGTAPNALVYGTGAVSASEMARAGLVLNLVSIVLITLNGLWLVPRVLP